MINIIITSFNEPKATLRAVNVFLSQKISQKFKVIVVDPFPEVGRFLKKEIKDERFVFFLDPGEGKSCALNLLFQEFYSNDKNDIFILTDGDVYVSQNAVFELLTAFKNPKIGCVTGKPVPLEDRKTKYGYWANFLFDAAHKLRKKLSEKKVFFECSGYLFAIRNGVIKGFPGDVSEDSIIPHLFWKKGFEIFYAEKAEVYVKNPDNWNDWKNQKIRNIKGHENLSKIAPELPRTKTFFNEVKNGLFVFFAHPKNCKELFWLAQLYFARLYIYLVAFKEIKKNKEYSDGWREVEIKSTKPLD
ncbi:glycosyltransferase [Candidatus Pacearchaeota archaeon]|nr:glycosyltransferase [Candidatus Pacearchaeota archaeon]